ncbi:MAG: hypothetical protein PUA75_02310 [Clostridiales bacterium]|nr:hypothetical protein [Clostridiales bacterium]
MLRFGYLIAHEGMVDGKQLLSPSYIREATSHLADTLVTAPCRSEGCGYGYQFWRNEKGGYVCYGMGGQLIIFLPDYNLICVTTADTQGIGGGNQLIYDALYDEILPFIRKEPLPEDKKSHCELLTTLENLEIAPLSGTVTSPLTKKVQQVCYLCEENDFGFSEFSFDFYDKPLVSDTPNNTTPQTPCGMLHFTLHGKSYSLSFGFGHLVTGDFPIYHQKYAASGIWFSEDTLYVKFHIIDAYVGSVHFEFCFGECDVTIFMKKQEESLFHEFNGHLYGVIENK